MTTNHITKDATGLPVQIRCKVCGVPIQDLVEVDNPHSTTTRKARDGTIIREIRMMLRPLANYAELTLICKNTDGTLSKHVTHGCKTDLGTLKTNFTALAGLMQTDIEELQESGMDQTIANNFQSRTVVGVE